MQWRDVDAVAKTLRVERAVTKAGRIKTTKTGEARTVDLTPRLVGALTALQAELEAEALLAGQNGIEPWVIADRTGRPLRPQRVGRVFHRIVQAAGLPRFVLNDLRHTYVSHLIAQGADPGYVARQMGHSSMVTTLSFYGHWFPKSDRHHVERMEQVRAAAVDEAPVVHDHAGLALDSEVNEDSWHRFGTSGDQLEMGAAEVIDLGGAEGGTRTPIQAAHLWPMAVSGRMDRNHELVIPANPGGTVRIEGKGRWVERPHPEYKMTAASSQRGRWFRFVTADPENPFDDPYALLGLDVSSSQTTILAILLGLTELEDIASEERFNEYLARRAWEKRTTVLNITGTDADYTGPTDEKLVKLVKQLWMRVLYGAPTAWTVMQQWGESDEVGPGWRKGTQKGQITRAATRFLDSIPQYREIRRFLKACQHIARRVDRYRGFEFTDPFDGVRVRWNPVARVDTYPSSSGLKLLVSVPGTQIAKGVNLETLETIPAKQAFHDHDPVTGDYPIDRKELRSMLAPCLTHALDAAFAGHVVEQLDARGAHDIVTVHDAFFTTWPLEQTLEAATREWFKSLGSVYPDLLAYLAPDDRTFRPMLEAARTEWQRRVECEDWPRFRTKLDEPLTEWK